MKTETPSKQAPHTPGLIQARVRLHAAEEDLGRAQVMFREAKEALKDAERVHGQRQRELAAAIETELEQARQGKEQAR